MAADDIANGLTQRFLRAFRDEMSTLHCRELTGFDLSTPEGLQDSANRTCRCMFACALSASPTTRR